MTHASNHSPNRFPVRAIVQLALVSLGLGIFFLVGIYSLLTASQTTLTCHIEPQACRLTRSTLISRQEVDFAVTQLQGAYLNSAGSVMLRVQPEYQFSEGVYAASAPYGQDILQQAIANKINAFVENPTTDLHLRVSNRLFKYVVGLTLIVTVGIFPAFLLSARQPGRRGASVRLPMVMVSLSLFLGGLLVVIAINHRIELRCANQQCVLLAWRLQDQGTLVMTAEALRAARIRQETYTNDEGDTQILHQVVLATDQGDFSLLANARAMPAIALAEEVNRFINHPATNQVNFRTDNWLLTAALGGVCGLLSGITLWWAFRS